MLVRSSCHEPQHPNTLSTLTPSLQPNYHACPCSTIHTQQQSCQSIKHPHDLNHPTTGTLTKP